MKRFMMVLLLAVTLGAEAAAPTVESAHAFIAEMCETKKLCADLVDLYEDRSRRGLWDIVSYQGSGCKSEFHTKQQNERKYHISVDWSKVSAVRIGQANSWVNVNGMIHIAREWTPLGQKYYKDSRLTGDTQMWESSYDSSATADRMVKAFEFLRKKCDTSQKHGF